MKDLQSLILATGAILILFSAWRCDQQIRYGDEWFVSGSPYGKKSVVVSRVLSFADWKLTICFHSENDHKMKCIFDPGDRSSYVIDVLWTSGGDEVFVGACDGGGDIYGYSYSGNKLIPSRPQIDQELISLFASGLRTVKRIGFERFSDFCSGQSGDQKEELNKKYFMRYK